MKEPDTAIAAPAKPDQPATKTIVLRYGVDIDGAHVRTISMRPPLARDSCDAQRGANVPAEIEIKLFANLCSMAPAAIEQLHMADYIAVLEAYQSFLG